MPRPESASLCGTHRVRLSSASATTPPTASESAAAAAHRAAASASAWAAAASTHDAAASLRTTRGASRGTRAVRLPHRGRRKPHLRRATRGRCDGLVAAPVRDVRRALRCVTDTVRGMGYVDETRYVCVPGCCMCALVGRTGTFLWPYEHAGSYTCAHRVKLARKESRVRC
jgi:hypothetical protein